MSEKNRNKAAVNCENNAVYRKMCKNQDYLVLIFKKILQDSGALEKIWLTEVLHQHSWTFLFSQ